VPQVGKSVGRLAQGSAGNQSAQVGLPTKSYCACLTPAAPAGRERRHQEPNPRRTSVSGTPRYGGKSRRELEIAVQVPAVRIIRIGPSFAISGAHDVRALFRRLQHKSWITELRQQIVSTRVPRPGCRTGASVRLALSRGQAGSRNQGVAKEAPLRDIAEVIEDA
jgi:hypothetical protein